MTAQDRQFDRVEVTSRLLNLILDMPIEKLLDLLHYLDGSDDHFTRRHARRQAVKPWLITIDSLKESTATKALVKDISRGGAFIETEESFSLGHGISMTFKLPASRKLCRIFGTIVRIESTGIGVKFERP